MIIKSISRKKPRFKNLIEYINKDDSNSIGNNNLTVTKNLYWTSQKDIIEEFESNSTNLKEIKNWNYLYHEIISLDPNITKDIPKKDLITILNDLWEKYLEARAKNNLCYWKIHFDKKHIHLHLCISSNEVYSNKRYRLSKQEFKNIQIELENYKNEKYPILQNTKIYNKDNENNLKYTKDEQELKKRTQNPSKKEQFKAKLENILDSSQNYKKLVEELKKAKIDIVKRWKTITVIDLDDKNRKYRLKTLWLLDKLQSFKEKVEKINQRKNEIEEFKELHSQPLETNKFIMNSTQAKKIQLTDLLQKLWFEPIKTNSNEVWYKSPFRDETTASFKVDITKNIWYDHWLWEWWNILDFVMLYNWCDFKQALEYLWHTIEPSTKPKEQKTIEDKPKISKLILQEYKPLWTTKALLEYIESRAININIASKFINEVYYKTSDKTYYWIWFYNDSWWIEVNNKYFKWSIWKKDITTYCNDSNKLVIFEGYFDFLSYISISNFNNKDFIILNSISQSSKAIKYINSKEYKNIELYFDNDNAWKEATNKFKVALEDKIKSKEMVLKDKSYLYKKYKDFNEYIIAKRDKRIEDLAFQKEQNKVLERVRQREC